MNQTYDGSYSQRLQAAEPLIRPGPVGAGYTLGGGPLPEHGVAERADSQGGKAFQVIWTIRVTRTLYLVEVPIAYAIDRTLNTTPDIRKHEVVVPKHVSESFRHGGVLPPGLCFQVASTSRASTASRRVA
jgi:hypothetical protein